MEDQLKQNVRGDYSIIFRSDDDCEHVAFGRLGSKQRCLLGPHWVMFYFVGHQERPRAETVGLRHHVC
jgi:hypothetical protein